LFESDYLAETFSVFQALIFWRKTVIFENAEVPRIKTRLSDLSDYTIKCLPKSFMKKEISLNNCG